MFHGSLPKKSEKSDSEELIHESMLELKKKDYYIEGGGPIGGGSRTGEGGYLGEGCCKNHGIKGSFVRRRELFH